MLGGTIPRFAAPRTREDQVKLYELLLSHRHSERLKGVEESPSAMARVASAQRFLDSLRSLGMTDHGEPEQ